MVILQVKRAEIIMYTKDYHRPPPKVDYGIIWLMFYWKH